MKDVLYLAWRYLAYNRGKTAVLVASIMLVVYLPLTLRVLVASIALGWLSYERNGVVRNTPRRGGDGGSTEVFKLRGNEKLVDLDAAGQGGIDRLTVATNKRVRTFGNDGSSGNLSSWLTDEQKRQYVGVGIIGRADDQLRQLSLHVQVRE